MATTIVTKKGSGAPAASDLVEGELAVDTTNGRLYTENSSAAVVELGSNPSGNITFGDNGKAIFGAGSDLQIYHDGSNSYIDEAGTGTLYVRADSATTIANPSNTLSARFRPSTSVSLYYNGVEKLATTATGIDVTGTVTADGLTVASSSDPALITLRQTGNTSGFIIKNFDNDEAQLVNADNGPMVFKTNDTEAMRIDSGGNLLVGKATTAIETVGINLFGTGRILATADGDDVVVLNRKNSDGDIAVFKKDSSTTVGSIGTLSSKIHVGSGDTSLFFDSLRDALVPHNGSTNAARDAAIDLGRDVVRFKDLYLSGGALTSTVKFLTNTTVSGSDATIFRPADNTMAFSTNGAERMKIASDGVAHFNGDVKVLSGDIQMGSGRGINFSASSNAGGMTSETLDDYEEGTWSVTSAVGLTITSAVYTRVGRVVHLVADITFASGSASGSDAALALPFNNLNTYSSGSLNYTTHSGTPTINIEGHFLKFRASVSGSALSYANVGGHRFIFHAAYFAA